MGNTLMGILLLNAVSNNGLLGANSYTFLAPVAFPGIIYPGMLMKRKIDLTDYTFRTCLDALPACPAYPVVYHNVSGGVMSRMSGQFFIPSF
jgi:hypothetical protein